MSTIDLSNPTDASTFEQSHRCIRNPTDASTFEQSHRCIHIRYDRLSLSFGASRARLPVSHRQTDTIDRLEHLWIFGFASSTRDCQKKQANWRATNDSLFALLVCIYDSEIARETDDDVDLSFAFYICIFIVRICIFIRVGLFIFLFLFVYTYKLSHISHAKWILSHACGMTD